MHVLMNEDRMGSKQTRDGYSSDDSADSMFVVQFDMNAGGVELVDEKLVTTRSVSQEVERMVPMTMAQSPNVDFALAFGAQLQGFLLQALMQSTSAITGLPTNLTSHLQNQTTLKQSISAEEESPQKTWSDRTYNIVKAPRRRETEMTRTSAGEGSDSQKEFTIPENESLQERAVRLRRLNRHRAKRAKDLTNNRRAFKKRPYVIHVDGMAKARGIHKHSWRAALRGQCGCLDPTMDNINHHPKSVVDSIWHALEKEWEFEGFTHRAREMFERSATKFMRNRKMQLKYKSQKMVEGTKPDDVNGKFWSKIIDLKKPATKSIMSALCENASGSKQVDHGNEDDKDDSILVDKVPKQFTATCTGRSLETPLEDAFFKEDDVDARILSLQRELLRLEKSRKLGFVLNDGSGCSGSKDVEEQTTFHAFNTVSKSMKENVQPIDANVEGLQCNVLASKRRLDAKKNEQSVDELNKEKLSKCVEEDRVLQVRSSASNTDGMEMDCGDVVRVFSFTGGRKEEIGKGIVMGLSGTKFAKKEIPKGWRSLKFTSYTDSGGSKICPFPLGWPEQVKSKTVKEVNGRSILWPDTLLCTLVENWNV